MTSGQQRCSLSLSLSLRDWTEPAHPSIVALYADVIGVYKAMKGFQPEIDDAFDRAAKEIGLVITTTVPVRIEVGDGGKITTAKLDGQTLVYRIRAAVVAALGETRTEVLFQHPIR
ncbi:MAG: hypothetical protein ACLP01_24605 [Solirubrobacteraceae bacterium]